MRIIISAALVAILSACGGGGGGGSAAPLIAPQVAAAPVQEVIAPPVPPLAVLPVATGCTAIENARIFCDLTPSGTQPVGLTIPAGAHGVFTNNTGAALRIDEVTAYTGERMWWSEYCVYMGELKLGQDTPGRGEIGCATKQTGDDYAPIRWGSGLLVAPGAQVIINAHTEPANTAHVYSLTVSAQASGLQSWRQPQHDHVFPCDESQQLTAWSPWRNDTGQTLRLLGASIYSENAGNKDAPNSVAAACVYVFNADSSLKHQNCDDRLRTRGDIDLPLALVEPGEFVGAQAINSCKSGHLTWDWAAFLRVAP